MDAHPDALLPKRELTLRQFNNLAEAIRTDPNLTADGQVNGFVRAALAGRHGAGETETRIYIDAIKGLTDGVIAPYGEPPTEAQFQLARDYDSIIGHSDNLPYSIPLGVFIVPPFAEGIRKDLHVKRRITTRNGDELLVDIGAIPNMPFAKVLNRGTCNLALPALYGHTARGVVERDLCRQFYEVILRPSLLEIDLEHIAHWPPSYEAAEQKYRDVTGKFRFSTVELPVHCFKDVVRVMKRKMDAIPVFRGWFFIHDMRGVKGGSIHDPNDPEEVELAVNETCQYLDMDVVPTTQFWIDIGLEIRRPRHVVQWYSGAHNALLHLLLPNSTDDQIDKILRSPNCHRDPNALLTDFAGLRVAPGTRAAGDGVVYINVYTTDKEVHYQLHKGVFRRHEPQDLFPGRIDRLIEDIDKWIKVMRECMGGENDHALQQGAARVEVRVPLHAYNSFLVDWDADLVNQLISAVPSMTWWKFKWTRAMACSFVLDRIRHTPAVQRRWMESLALGAGVIYILNALFYTPDTGAVWQSLAEHSRMKVPDEEQDGYASDYDDIEEMEMKDIGDRQGLFFFGHIVEDRRSLRLSRKHRLPANDIVKLYGEHTDYNLRAHFQVASIRREAAPKPVLKRHNNKGSDTSRVTETRLEPIPNIDFGLTARGVEFTNLATISGPDADEDVDDGNEATNMDQRVATLWCQMLDDVLVGKGPNPKSRLKPSYGAMDSDGRAQINEAMFKCFRLPFTAARYREASAAHWATMFNRFFPPPGSTIPHAMQGFPACRYFKDYMDLIGQMQPNDIKLLRAALRSRWNTLYWMPYTGTDRMWVTREASGKQAVALPSGLKGAAPLIGLNPAFTRGAYSVELGVGGE